MEEYFKIFKKQIDLKYVNICINDNVDMFS